ncbi:MAG: cytochrome-c peroxidase [Methylococcales bacterium]|nr:cytochrome-c peroxidase [Methylococcales bacterium]
MIYFFKKTFVFFFFIFCSYFIYLQINILLSSQINSATLASSYADKNTQAITPIPVKQNLNKAIVLLGKQLFFETRLSKNDTVSCASCHNIHNAGVDGLIISAGIHGQIGSFNAPTVFNSSLNFKQFWDGRANTLEDQIDGPINNPVEMDSSWSEVIEKLTASAKYAKLFKMLFPKQGITEQSIKNAIVTFERSLLTPNSRFDLYLKGQQDAITKNEKKGYQLFNNLGCISCHQGVNVGGNMFAKMGVIHDYFADKELITKADLGRFKITKKNEDKYLFKVPGLRNIELTGPYFHDGQTRILKSAVQKMAYYQLGVKLSEKETRLIVAFLKTLTAKVE